MIRIPLILDAFLDIIYPRIYCILCGERLEKKALHGICNHCLESLPFIHPPRCAWCSKPVEGKMPYARNAGCTVMIMIRPLLYLNIPLPCGAYTQVQIRQGIQPEPHAGILYAGSFG